LKPPRYLLTELRLLSLIGGRCGRRNNVADGARTKDGDGVKITGARSADITHLALSRPKIERQYEWKTNGNTAKIFDT